MVIKRRAILEQLKELDTIMEELEQYQSLSEEEIRSNLSRRWVIERGLIAAAALILDIAEHILVGHFGRHEASYEENLLGLADEGVISPELYSELKGLGGFRNVLVHMYQEIDVRQVWNVYQKGTIAFPRFAQEVLLWLEQEKAN